MAITLAKLAPMAIAGLMMRELKMYSPPLRGIDAPEDAPDDRRREAAHDHADDQGDNQVATREEPQANLDRVPDRVDRLDDHEADAERVNQREPAHQAAGLASEGQFFLRHLSPNPSCRCLLMI